MLERQRKGSRKPSVRALYDPTARRFFASEYHVNTVAQLSDRANNLVFAFP